MSKTNWMELDREHIAPTYARFPVVASIGKGAILTDENGKEYIDFGSGIGVTSFGYCDPLWVEAVQSQAAQLQHTSNLYYTKPCIELAALLCQKTGMSKVFFSNSGAEANECAIKVARQYAEKNHGKEYSTILTLKESFHGRTLTTLAATGQVHYHEQFQPLTPGFVFGDSEDIEKVRQMAEAEKAAGILLECVQGEGGVNVMSRDFVRGVADICKEKDILLMIDEVQTGNGRTGKLYSYMHYDIEPDVVSTAKGLGGGMPIGATLMSDKCADVFSPGDHGSTFGGNPVVCAGALSILSRMDDDFLAQVGKKGQMIRDHLTGKPGVKEITGLGMMVGIVTERAAGDIVKDCLEAGVLCLTAKDKLRLLPPLNIPEEDLMRGLDIVAEACAKQE